MNMLLSIHEHVLSQDGMARNIPLDHPMTGVDGGKTGYRSPTSYQHEDINSVISMNHWGMNVGNFLMPRSEWSDWLLDLWIEPLYIFQNWVFPENDRWRHMWQYHEIARNHTACMNQLSIDAYPDYNALGRNTGSLEIISSISLAVAVMQYVKCMGQVLELARGR